MSKERVDFRFMGRALGTGTGWDEGDDGSFCIYDFIAAPGVNLPTVDSLWVLPVEGQFATYKDDGTHAMDWDILETLAGAPRSEPKEPVQ